MTPIRPVAREDLRGVAELYEAVARSGTRTPPPPDLAPLFERTLLDHPWYDEEIPSLVFEDPEAGIVGFLGSHVRRFRFGDRPVRVACSGQLVSDPAFRGRGAGALLLRRYLAGPQELTITDGATEDVRTMWQGLGGRTSIEGSIGWTKVFRPASFAAAMAARRRGSEPRGAAVAAALDRPARRFLGSSAPTASTGPLSPAAMLEGVARLERSFRLLPAYDEQFLDWLFREVAAVHQRGELVRKLVHSPAGGTAGWFVYYSKPRGISQVLQVGAAQRDAGLVLDALFHDAESRGGAALQGRVEPHLYPDLSTRRCLFRRTEWALVQSREPELLAALAYGDALLTRLEGEWWMGYHLPGAGEHGGLSRDAS